MATVNNIFSHSIGRKLIMALTGGFLVLFLTGHLAGNLILLTGDGLAFNEYAEFMTTSPAVKVLSYLTYLSIILHVVYSIILSRANNSARSVKYAYNKPAKSSIWSSRNMGVLGLIVLLFLVIHMKSFWYEMHFGSLPKMEGTEFKDLYTIVVAAFAQWWYVALYVVAMAGLAYHLIHGFQSAFQTLGLTTSSYTPLIKKIGMAYAIGVPILFAIIPVYMFISQL